MSSSLKVPGDAQRRARYIAATHDRRASGVDSSAASSSGAWP